MNRLLSILIVFQVFQTALAAAPIPTRPVYTRSKRFRIPFRFDAVEMQRLGAREIRLFESRDRGKRWNLVGSAVPDAGHFDYKASSDGEYWFAVRTVDRRGELHPAGLITTPGLKVVVDTQQPRIDLALRQSEPGKVELDWTVADPNLDPSSLEIESIQNGDARWQEVNVLPRLRGSTSWTVARGGNLAVRASVKDHSGNVARTQAQLKIDPPQDIVPKPNVPPEREGPIAGTPGPLAKSLPERYPSGGDLPALEKPDNPFVPAPHPAFARSSTNDSVPDEPDRAGGFRDLPLASSAELERSRDQLIGDRPSSRPDITRGRYGDAQSESRKPRKPPFRAVNSRKFQIAYQLDDIGPSGVSRVEMFITQDDGRKWYKYGNDPDHKSPFDIQVPADGVYGFALRVRSGSGIVEDPPQPGDRPEILTLVDQKPPVVELLPLQQGQGVDRHKIRIRWRATDDNLTEKPVALFYAEKLEGPWKKISDWTENRGSFVWTVKRETPSRLHVRIAVRDLAGNETLVETPRPVVVDLSRPSARIVDIEAAGPQ